MVGFWEKMSKRHPVQSALKPYIIKEISGWGDEEDSKGIQVVSTCQKLQGFCEDVTTNVGRFSRAPVPGPMAGWLNFSKSRVWEMNLDVPNPKTVSLADGRKPAFQGHQVREWNIDEVLPTATSRPTAILTTIVAVSRDIYGKCLTWESLILLRIVEVECTLTV